MLRRPPVARRDPAGSWACRHGRRGHHQEGAHLGNTPSWSSARSEDHDKVEALDARWRTTIWTKPFSVEELLARLRVSPAPSALRHREGWTRRPASTQNGGLKIRLRRRLHHQEREGDPLTSVEFTKAAVPAGPRTRQGAHPATILNRIYRRRLPSDTSQYVASGRFVSVTYLLLPACL